MSFVLSKESSHSSVFFIFIVKLEENQFRFFFMNKIDFKQLLKFEQCHQHVQYLSSTYSKVKKIETMSEKIFIGIHRLYQVHIE
jgi:hypothetical protein